MKKAAHISILAYLNTSTNKRINTFNLISNKLTDHVKKKRIKKTNQKLNEKLFRTYNVAYDLKDANNQISSIDNVNSSSINKSNTKPFVNHQDIELRKKIRDLNKLKSKKIKELLSSNRERSKIKNDQKFLKKFNKLVLDKNNSKINIKNNKKLCSQTHNTQDLVRSSPKLEGNQDLSQSFSSRSNSENSLKNSINIKLSLEATFATKKVS
jgi:hypothetical protein